MRGGNGLERQLFFCRRDEMRRVTWQGFIVLYGVVAIRTVVKWMNREEDGRYAQGTDREAQSGPRLEHSL